MVLQDLLDESFETTAGKSTLREMLDSELPTVFIAYPMDFTPVCTKQLCSYRDHWSELSSLPCRWWALNTASMEKHERFKEQKQLPFELISDPDGKLLKALGLWGWLQTKRGFSVVSPQAEILGVTSIFPFVYQGHKDVIAFLRPLIGLQPA